MRFSSSRRAGWSGYSYLAASRVTGLGFRLDLTCPLGKVAEFYRWADKGHGVLLSGYSSYCTEFFTSVAFSSCRRMRHRFRVHGLLSFGAHYEKSVQIAQSSATTRSKAEGTSAARSSGIHELSGCAHADEREERSLMLVGARSQRPLDQQQLVRLCFDVQLIAAVITGSRTAAAFDVCFARKTLSFASCKLYHVCLGVCVWVFVQPILAPQKHLTTQSPYSSAHCNGIYSLLLISPAHNSR